MKTKPIDLIEESKQFILARKHARANKRMRDILAKRKTEHMFNHPRNRA